MSAQLVSALAALLVFASIGLLWFGIQSSRARASSPEMEERLDRFANVAAPTTESDQNGRAAAAVTEAIDRAVKGKSFGEKLQTQLARADLKMTIGEFLAIRGGSAIIGFLFGLVLGRAQIALAVLFGIVFALIGWMVPAFYLKIRAGRRQRAFVGQLGDTIALMANSLRAGYSLLQTMELVSREAPSPMGEEFRRVVREVGLGVSPQQALNNLLRRVPSEDLDLMVSAINIQHEIGGNLGQILDVIGETIRERVRIQGEIGVLTAQGKLSGNVITAMPAALAIGLFLLNPDYMTGVLVMPWICIPIGALVLLIIGHFVMKRIVTIEV